MRQKYDRNTAEYLKIANLLATDGGNDPDLQLKITAFMSADIVVSNFFNRGIKIFTITF